MDHSLDVGQKVRVTAGPERGMIFTAREADGGWYAVTGRAFKTDYPWRFKVEELEPFVPWWKRLHLWARR